MSSCADKHNNPVNKFCPECGTKLEHLDINKLNEEYSKMTEENDKYVEKMRQQGYAISMYKTFTPIVSNFVANRKITEELFFYNDKYHTKKQMMEDLKISDEKNLDKIFSKHGTISMCSWVKCDAESVQRCIESFNLSMKLNEIYGKITDELKIDKRNNYDDYGYSQIRNSLSNIIISLDDKCAIEKAKTFLKRFSEEL